MQWSSRQASGFSGRGDPVGEIALVARLECAAIIAGKGSPPQKTSQLLAATMSGLTSADADALPTAVRQSLLLEMALSLGSWPAYFVVRCPHCEELADVTVTQRDFEGQIAASAPAQVSLAVSETEMSFRAPNGTDEIAVLAEPAMTESQFLRRLTLEHETADEILAGLSEGGAEAAISEITALCCPPVGTIPLPCPACGGIVTFWFDGFEWIARHIGSAIEDVSLLARAFGWTEDAICALPQARRDLYLRHAREALT